MVFDAKRKTIVLLGGAHQPEDLWEWDGSGWKKWEGQQPRARSHASLAYGGQKDQLMLFGGFAPGRPGSPSRAMYHSASVTLRFSTRSRTVASAVVPPSSMRP